MKKAFDSTLLEQCNLCRAIEKQIVKVEEIVCFYNTDLVWCGISSLWANRRQIGSCTKPLFDTSLQERVGFAIELY